MWASDLPSSPASPRPMSVSESQGLPDDLFGAVARESEPEAQPFLDSMRRLLEPEDKQKACERGIGGEAIDITSLGTLKVPQSSPIPKSVTHNEEDKELSQRLQNSRKENQETFERMEELASRFEMIFTKLQVQQILTGTTDAGSKSLRAIKDETRRHEMRLGIREVRPKFSAQEIDPNLSIDAETNGSMCDSDLADESEDPWYHDWPEGT